MGKNMLADRIGGMVAVVLGVVSIIEAVRLFPMRTSTWVGDHTLPALLGAIMILLGVLLIFVNKADSFQVEFPDRKILGKMVATIGLLFAYWAIIPLLGYAISTLVVVSGLFKVIAAYRFSRSVLLGALTTAILYIIFIVWLNMPFPAGIFTT